MTLIEERYELVKERLQDMLTEQAVSEKYTEYFHQMAEFGLLVMQNYEHLLLYLHDSNKIPVINYT